MTQERLPPVSDSLSVMNNIYFTEIPPSCAYGNMIMESDRCLYF